MVDATRKAIEEVLRDWHVLARAHKAAEPVREVLEEALARDAETTTIVSPEWLDGAEAKRLGFERTGDDGHWFLSSSPRYRVAVERGCSVLSVHERGDLEGLLFRNPTVAQVRAAVFLATGRE